MPDWNTIAKLSGREAKNSAAHVEAEMLAMAAQANSPIPAASPAPSNPTLPTPTVVATRDGIQISVTDNGQTTRYSSLEAVPGPVRQQIMNAWILAPAAARSE